MRCRMLLAVFLVAAVCVMAVPAMAGGRPDPPGGPWLFGTPIEPNLVVSSTGGNYILRGWTDWSWHQPLTLGDLHDITPQADRLASCGPSTSAAKWDLRLDLWVCDVNESNVEVLTGCGPGLVSGLGDWLVYDPPPIRVQPPPVMERRHPMGLPLMPPREGAPLVQGRSGGDRFQPRPPMGTAWVEVRNGRRLGSVVFDPGRDWRVPPQSGCINCQPDWSPDGSMIAYWHAMPVEGEYPCITPGFEFRVINADGSDDHRVSAEADGSVCGMCWAPDGSRVLYEAAGSDGETIGVVIDRDGDESSRRVLHNVGSAPDWSPNGWQIVSAFQEEGVGPDGTTPGVWARLRITDFASDRVVDPEEPLYEYFVPNDVVSEQVIPDEGERDRQRARIVQRTCHLAKWSPSGRWVAFLGIDWASVMEDPPDMSSEEFPDCWVEVWMVNTETRELVQLTSNGDFEHNVEWNGPNTSLNSRTVWVFNTSVSFLNVTRAGRTTVMQVEPALLVPMSSAVVSDVYRITTTAEYDGRVLIYMEYDQRRLRGRDESTLRMMRATGPTLTAADNITVATDPGGDRILGLVNSLDPVSMYFLVAD